MLNQFAFESLEFNRLLLQFYIEAAEDFGTYYITQCEHVGGCSVAPVDERKSMARRNASLSQNESLLESSTFEEPGSGKFDEFSHGGPMRDRDWIESEGLGDMFEGRRR